MSTINGKLPFRAQHYSKVSWVVALTPATIGIVLMGIGGFLGYFFGSMFFAASAVILYYEYKEIPADPPHIAMLTIAGKRVPVILREGILLLVSTWPFLIDIIKVSVALRNEDLSFVVRCKLAEPEDAKVKGENGFERTMNRLRIKDKDDGDPKSGGQVSIRVAVTWRPDYMSTDGSKYYPDNIRDFINAEQDAGVVDIFSDDISEDLRQLGRRLPWLNLAFAMDIITAHLIQKLTGARPKRLGTNDEIDVTEATRPEEIQTFIDTILDNGQGDLRKLGIKIHKLNVKEVEPLGKLSESAEDGAVEILKREGLIQNAAALRKAMRTLKSRTDKSLTDADILEALQAEDGVVKKEVKTIRIPDADKIVGALATIIGGLSK